MSNISKDLVEFAHQLDYENLSQDVVQKAKTHVLDCMGVSIGAYQTPWAQTVIEQVKQFGGKKEASILVDKSRVPAVSAAFANGTLAHSLEFDDTHIESTCHPGSVVIPPALAVAEQHGLSGKKLILAIVAGYEIMLRIGAAIFPSHRDDRKFHITATTGNFGSAVATAKLLGLDTEAFLNGFGLAGDQASSGLFSFITDGSMSKRIHAGRAAMNGLISVLLADRGVTGSRNILQGDYGFLQAYTEDYQLNKLTPKLGGNFAVMDCWCKQFPCCGHLQGLVRLAIKLKQKHGIDPDRVAGAKGGTYKAALAHNKSEINSPLDAQESASFVVAAALTTGDLSLEDIFQASSNSQILNFMDKVEVGIDSEISESRGTRLTVEMEGGSEVSALEESPLEMGRQMIIDKFTKLSEPVIPTDRSEKLIDLVERLEEVENVQEVTSLVQGKGVSTE